MGGGRKGREVGGVLGLSFCGAECLVEDAAKCSVRSRAKVASACSNNNNSPRCNKQTQPQAWELPWHCLRGHDKHYCCQDVHDHKAIRLMKATAVVYHYYCCCCCCYYSYYYYYYYYYYDDDYYYCSNL